VRRPIKWSVISVMVRYCACQTVDCGSKVAEPGELCDAITANMSDPNAKRASFHSSLWK
jgi:hypothetical protein